MKNLRMMALIGIVVAVGSFVEAQGQATRTWISGLGDDFNPCSITAPCKTFIGAFAKTAADGEISLLDAGSFGIVTITRGVTTNGNGVNGGILSTTLSSKTVRWMEYACQQLPDKLLRQSTTFSGPATGKQ